ncbi:MAG: hypothetical protein M0Z87_03020 [Actinomycetota bacterium]|nr:hypothetical protein [Actinomycetota bacterium]
MSKPKVRSRKLALWGGIALTVAGSYLVYDAYEHRGRKRPWLLRILPSA